MKNIFTDCFLAKKIVFQVKKKTVQVCLHGFCKFCEKFGSFFALAKDGGVDEVRTRDLPRDRRTF